MFSYFRIPSVAFAATFLFLSAHTDCLRAAQIEVVAQESPSLVWASKSGTVETIDGRRTLVIPVNADDVLMLELAGERSLVEELLTVDRAELGVAKHFRLDGLQRDFLAGKGVFRQVDGTGRALAEQLLDLVLADLEAKVEFEIVRHAPFYRVMDGA